MSSLSIASLLISIFSGLFAAFLGWVAVYSKWLLERRIEAFAKFIPLLADAFDSAERLRNAKSEDDWHNNWTAIQLEIMDIYAPVHVQANICKLFLPPKVREEFNLLTLGFWNKYEDGNFSKHSREISTSLDRIQEIFEQEVSFFSAFRSCVPTTEMLGRKKSQTTTRK